MYGEQMVRMLRAVDLLSTPGNAGRSCGGIQELSFEIFCFPQ